MKERIREFLLAENKSSAQMAEEIGVQPSGISHILSGRNNPSLDFILKMLERYDYIRTDWLLFGKGSMYREPVMKSLFDETEVTPADKKENLGKNTTDSFIEAIGAGKSVTGPEAPESGAVRMSEVTRIVWFYADNSFEEYFPQRQK